MTAKLTTSTNGASFPYLLADIGGSNARFGLKLHQDAQISHIKTISVALHAGPTQAAQAYLNEIAVIMGVNFQSPCKAAFAVATAVAGDQVTFTNSHWSFSRTAVQKDLKLTSFLVLNDFEALALSLPQLNASQLRAHQALPTAHGTLAVIGPGTGLGVAGITQHKQAWIALPCEGGHATLAASNNFESAVLDQVRLTYPHVSAERLLSGIGLPVLHAAIATLRGMPSSTLTTELIVERGLDGGDAICSETLDIFCAFLGSFAGNVALLLGARGGVYIGGGIVPRLGERFFNSRFRECFEAKGRLHSYLKAIPTALITDTLAALTGAAFALDQQDR